MLPELAGMHVLVELADPAATRRASDALRATGFEPSTCDGRGPGGRGCPLLRGLPCPLVDQADAIVCGLGPEPITEAVIAAIGERAQPPVRADSAGVLEAVRRVRARRARHVRRLVEVRGRRLLVRAAAPGDRDRLRDFDAGLSQRTRRLRYLSYMPPLTDEQLERMASVDFNDRFAFVAIDGRGAGRRVVADARLFADADHPGRADLAVAIADEVQGAGLGPRLVRLLVEVAAERGFEAVGAEVWWENQPMVHVLRRLGFDRTAWELGVMTFRRRLPA